MSGKIKDLALGLKSSGPGPKLLNSGGSVVLGQLVEDVDGSLQQIVAQRDPIDGLNRAFVKEFDGSKRLLDRSTMLSIMKDDVPCLKSIQATKWSSVESLDDMLEKCALLALFLADAGLANDIEKLLSEGLEKEKVREADRTADIRSLVKTLQDERQALTEKLTQEKNDMERERDHLKKEVAEARTRRGAAE